MGFEGVSIGKNFNIDEREGFVLYHVQNKTGEGHIAFYEVIEGVYLTYNDFHMAYCESQLKSSIDLLCIDHCREGRIEEATGERYKYVSSGDVRIDNRHGHNTTFSFPFSHYHGMTIAFDVIKAEASMKKIFPNFSVDLVELRKKYCEEYSNVVVRDVASIDRIFGELYQVPEMIKQSYYEIKIYELILVLLALEMKDFEDHRPYFYKTNVEKIKSIHKELVTNLDKHYTIEDLSSMYDIATTTLKKCFKGVYGNSIYAYTKQCRINHGAKLLKTTNMNIADIGLSVGYGSPSKFTASFKSITGMTPVDYRKNFRSS